MLFVTGIRLKPKTVTVVGLSFPNTRCEIQINYENFGRTPAIITKIDRSWLLARMPPKTPVYKEISQLPTGTIVRGCEKTSFETTTYAIDLTPEERAAIDGHETSFWAYGFIEYRDFLGNDHKTGFCGIWQPYMGGRFLEAGPSNYIYQN
jgi:hypothetical protein